MKYGTNIRIRELVNNLRLRLIYSPTRSRILTYMRSASTLHSEREVLLFGSRGRFFDNALLSALRKHGTAITYDLADIPHLQNFYLGGRPMDFGLARRFYSLVKAASNLLVISESLLHMLDKETTRDKRIMIVPNAADPDFFEPAPLPEKTKIITYVGSYAPARGIEQLVEAFNSLAGNYQDIHLRLIGFNMPSKFAAQRIRVERDIIYADMPLVNQEAYVCVLPYKRNPYMDAGLPIKLFEAMASSRPIVTTDCFEQSKIVRQEKCGIVAHDSPASIARALEELILDPKMAEEMGNNGRKAVLARHSWKHRAERIRDLCSQEAS